MFYKKINCKLNKIWVDKGRLHNRFMKSWIEDNGTEMYSTNNEGKSIIVEKFIRTLKKKIHKYMTLISNNVKTDN